MKMSNREKILAEGMRLVLERGFFGASVRDIVEAAGVPQGSFTNHFPSKEAFGLEILDIYFSETRAVLDRTLRHPGLAPLDALRAFLDANKARLCAEGMEHGCLSGNVGAEASARSETLRLRLLAIFDEIIGALRACLERAVHAGALPPGTDCAALAGFILLALQGAMLLSKVQHSLRPLEQLDYVLFSLTLSPLSPHDSLQGVH